MRLGVGSAPPRALALTALAVGIGAGVLGAHRHRTLPVAALAALALLSAIQGLRAP